MEKTANKKPKKNKGVYTVLMLICIAVFLFALYKVVGILMDYKEIDDYYNNANDDFVVRSDDGSIYKGYGYKLSCASGKGQPVLSVPYL